MILKACRQVNEQRQKSTRLMFVAGENSGDQHAAALIEKLRELRPDLSCFGFGGLHMARAGMRLEYNLAQGLPIIGITQALRHYPTLRALFIKACNLLDTDRPDALVLVDYPGFNLRLAHEAVKRDIPVIYYIAPQIWAWHPKRVHSIRQSVSLLMVIFPFEEKLFREYGIDARYVGHPLLDRVSVPWSREHVAEMLGVRPDQPLIGLIPGSRQSEIEHHFEIMLEAARIMKSHIKDSVFVVPRAHTVSPDLLQSYVERYPDLSLRIIDEHFDSVRGNLDFALCKSGTSTLELALANVPMVILYRVSTLTYLFARAVVKTKWIGLVNIVAGEELVPELLQGNATPEKIASTALSILSDKEQLEKMKEGFRRIRADLSRHGNIKTSTYAARLVLDYLDKRKGETPTEKGVQEIF